MLGELGFQHQQTGERSHSEISGREHYKNAKDICQATNRRVMKSYKTGSVQLKSLYDPIMAFRRVDI